MTKGNCENSLPEEAFGVNMEMLPFPWNISKNNMADYQEVQVCQVRHRDLVEVLGNRVDVLDNSGAVVHLTAVSVKSYLLYLNHVVQTLSAPSVRNYL